MLLILAQASSLWIKRLTRTDSVPALAHYEYLIVIAQETEQGFTGDRISK